MSDPPAQPEAAPVVPVAQPEVSEIFPADFFNAFANARKVGSEEVVFLSRPLVSYEAIDCVSIMFEDHQDANPVYWIFHSQPPDGERLLPAFADADCNVRVSI